MVAGMLLRHCTYMPSLLQRCRCLSVASTPPAPSYSPATMAAVPTTTTHQQLSVPTGWREGQAGGAPRHIPLAMTDAYVINEQLPYAYFFRETLCEWRNI
jgi:hypothetical protein